MGEHVQPTRAQSCKERLKARCEKDAYKSEGNETIVGEQSRRELLFVHDPLLQPHMNHLALGDTLYCVLASLEFRKYVLTRFDDERLTLEREITDVHVCKPLGLLLQLLLEGNRLAILPVCIYDLL